jgi:6-phosphogluconolactonase (cycloisomerase 2 family)
LALFSRDQQTGRLTLSEVHQNGVNGVQGLLTPQHLAVSADGRFIYVLGRSKTGEKPIIFGMP